MQSMRTRKEISRKSSRRPWTNEKFPDPALPFPRPLLALSSPGCLPSDLVSLRPPKQPGSSVSALSVFGVCGCGALCWPETSIPTLASGKIVSSLLGGSSDEPLQDGIQVGLFLRAYAVAGYLSMGYTLQVQGVYQLVYCEMATQIRFVAEDQKWDAFHGRLLKEDVELFLCHW